MDSSLEQSIWKSRKLLQNPYAHLNGEGKYDAIQKDGPDVHEARKALGNPYAYLDEDGEYGWFSTTNQVRRLSPLIEVESLLDGQKRNASLPKKEIRPIVRRLQREMWRRRTIIWPERGDLEPRDILDPVAALESLGYSVRIAESLGQYSDSSELFEIAGILDNDNREAHISRRFSPEIRKFTAAHELGHAILHTESGLHRDRALDGAGDNRARDSKEREADDFAVYFLLPEKQVRSVFEKLFLAQRFVLSEETAFALALGSLSSLRDRCRTLRDLTRMLASVEQYDHKYFPSMAKQFGVSTEAMAIRLEELRIVHHE